MKDVRKEKLEEGKIIPLTYDYVFTAIFNNPENIDIVENFLSCYLEIPLEKIKGKVKLCSRDLQLEGKQEANKQVDLILELEDEKINIELSNKVNQGTIDRNIIYACNIHSGNLKYGDNSYNKIGRTIQINLNNCRTSNKLKETYYFRNEEGKILSEKFRIDFVDMVIGSKLCYTDSESNLTKWCFAFTTQKKEAFQKVVGEIEMEEKARKKLIEEVDKYSTDEEVVALYSAYTRQELEYNTFVEDAKEEGIQQGIQQGVEQEKETIAKNLLKENVDIEIIMKVTGLTKEQISTIV